MAAWVGSTLVLPSQDGLRLRRPSASSGWRELASVALPAAVVMTVCLLGAAALAVLMANGALGIVRV